jgi:hypothetical protein
MASRNLVRLLIGASALSVLQVSFVSCGSDDGAKRAMDDAAGADAGGSSADGGQAGAPQSASSGAGADTASADGGAAGAASTLAQGGGAGAAEPSGGGAAGSAAISSSGADARGAGGAAACAEPITPSRITLAVDALNAERVTNLQWIDSDGATTANVTASGGPATCGDPPEFFGESYGAPEGTSPGPVVAGSRSSLAHCGLDFSITAAAADCNQIAQLPVFTEYHFYEGAKASQIRVTRTLGFDQTSPKYTGVGVRVWQPRVPLAVLPNVVYPNDNNAMTTVPANACPGDCVTPIGDAWNGKWFADLGSNGLALIVLRDPSMTSAVSLTVNYDSYSSANIASFVVMQPTDGWKAPITEIEYLCFADFKSWPQSVRDLAQLPAGCGP